MRFSVLSRRLCMLACLSALLTCGGAVAETGADQDLMSLKIEDLMRVKVYSASRHLEDVRQAPAAVTVITADEIRHYGWRTLSDALTSLRGFYWSNDRMYSYLGVRGFLRPGDYNSRILLLINGHRQNDNIYHTAAFDTEFPLDLDLIDHIEVVRGPGSSLFGTNAVFGVVNVITRRPAGESAIEVSGETSSFYERSGQVTAMGRKGNLSGLLSGRMYRNPGESTLFFPEFASPQSDYGFAKDMDETRTGNVFGDIQYGDFRVQGLWANRWKRFPTASHATVFNDPNDNVNDQHAYVDASYQHSLSSQTDLEIRTYYDEYRFIGQGAYPSPYGKMIGIVDARADWIGIEANLSRQIGKQKLTFGGEYEYTIDIKQRNYAVGSPADVLRSNRSAWLTAYYGDLELHVVPKLTIDVGGRIDYYNTFGATFSPRAALIYSINSRTSLKYIFGQAFRAPNAYEEYYVDNIVVEPTPRPLEPEQIRSHEVLVEHSVKPWLTLTGDGYYNQLEKLIDQVPNPSTGLTHFVNQGRAHSKGLEFEVQAKHRSGIEARASYGISSAFNDGLNSGLANSPLNQAKLNATLPVLRRGFAGIELLYLSAMQSYQGPRVSPFALTNFTFSTRPLWGGWEFSASCYNLLDRRWFSPMGPNDPEAAIQQDGRTFRFRLTYRVAIHDKPGQK